ncbi:hypothetical protein [Sphingomonas sp. Leaf343]|uniref:hypothetical protein n=1 Tax=Sphingomonas sp. Leaf343 TaxID=1736345 RepID=UPI0006FD3EB5|nr:hypothetical protein [Sphingomonas sp. Leaf343]KQR87380.1 hypothetical protein ASG07_00075 [Sphingomonas sp. Leaf343]
MDIDKPPSAEPAFVQGRAAPVRAGEAQGAQIIASGVGWTLVDLGEAMELRLAGAAPLVANDGRWRDTPRGPRLTAVTANGPLILDVTHGLCRPADLPPGAEPATGGFARMTLPDGRQVHGCMFAAGPYVGSRGDRAYPAR